MFDVRRPEERHSSGSRSLLFGLGVPVKQLPVTTGLYVCFGLLASVIWFGPERQLVSARPALEEDRLVFLDFF